MSQPTERYHSLDTLRALAMFLGIFLHGFLAYTITKVHFWPAQDPHRTSLGDIFVFTVHQFRMQVFFLLAGFFGCLLYERYQLRGMLLHRFKRIALPLVAAIFTILPILQVISLYGDPDALEYKGFPKPDLNQPTRAIIAEHFLSGKFLTTLPPYHLWFLYYLLICFVLIIPLLKIESLAIQSTFGQQLDRAFQRLLISRWSVIVLGLFTFPSIFFSYRWMIDAPDDSWIPRIYIVLYYFLFFGVGWFMYRHRDLLKEFVRYWKSNLLISNLVLLPIQLTCVAISFPKMGIDDLYAPGEFHLKLIAVSIGCIYTWMVVFGLVGLFLHCVNQERPWVRYIADSSYWCYLVHLIPVGIFQLILIRFDLPGEIKFLLVMVGSISLLLWSYDRFVRHTFLSNFLNGKKYPR